MYLDMNVPNMNILDESNRKVIATLVSDISVPLNQSVIDEQRHGLEMPDGTKI